MGIGFVVTIVLLAAVLGVFSKQVLASQDEPTDHIHIEPDFADDSLDMLDSASLQETEADRSHAI
ncbi:hypothetical protein [Alicyclobacillus acidiphilus]|uniref:hypothetical protein n=1 Tax=Alicyclobacillus acidiphilus TaxID=182455 RepID=UPI000833F5EF|nr:hypothetical protein [Alicyclobacillus acidiphilus]